MKHIFSILTFLLLIISTPLTASPAWHIEKAAVISEVIVKYYPEAQIVQSNGQLRAKYKTMNFTIHRKLKNGKVLEKTDVREGPSFRGFMLEFSIVAGKYRGPMIVPQILRRPYWETYVDRPKTEDEKGHYNISFSYGSRIDKEFKRALLDVLPNSRMLTNESKRQ